MAKKIAYCGIFSTLAIIIGYFEKFIVLPVNIPGIKIGLSNIVNIVILYKFGSKYSLFVLLTRIIILGMLFGGVTSFLYSFVAGIISFSIMLSFMKTNLFSVVGVSVIGSYFHNISQIILACFVMENFKILYYMPFLMFLSIGTGILTGFFEHENN